MAQIYGLAGEHSGKQSIAAFKKIFLTLFCIIAALCLIEGILIGLVVMRNGLLPWMLTATLFGAILYASRYAMKRVEEFEKHRLSYRAGFLGEHQVAIELEGLSDQFTVFNNVNTRRGNLDHVVVGPTGLFAIETKNWRGHITATADGELMKNGKPATAAHVRRFVSRAMMVRDQAIALTHRDDFRVRPVMVFPKAHVDAPYGSTGTAHCVRIDALREYIENVKFSAKLTDAQVEQLTRAMQGIACMDVDFAESPTTRDSLIPPSGG